jgi:hypothetical protein
VSHHVATSIGGLAYVKSIRNLSRFSRIPSRFAGRACESAMMFRANGVRFAARISVLLNRI